LVSTNHFVFVLQQFSSNRNFESTEVVYTSIYFRKIFELLFGYMNELNWFWRNRLYWLNWESESCKIYIFIVVSVYISKPNLNTTYYEIRNADVISMRTNCIE